MYFKGNIYYIAYYMLIVNLIMILDVSGVRIRGPGPWALDRDAWCMIRGACNTAHAESAGAEGLSGLAKAFFYAGSRALLVSHWPVES